MFNKLFGNKSKLGFFIHNCDSIRSYVKQKYTKIYHITEQQTLDPFEIANGTSGKLKVLRRLLLKVVVSSFDSVG